MRYSVNFENGTHGQRGKVIIAIEKAHEVMESDLFKERILNYTQPNGVKEFYQAEMGNEEVYKILMEREWKYSIRFYSKRFSSANAYVQPPSPVVNLNWAKMANWPLHNLANTTTHEATHLFGFTHDYLRTTNRPYSVPYGVGQIVEDIMNPPQISVDEVLNKPVRRSWWRRLF